MAHITLVNPRLSHKSMTGSYNRTSPSKLLPPKIGEIENAGSFTLLNVEIIGYHQVRIDAPWLGEHDDPATLLVDAVLMSCEEADRINPDIPRAFTFSTVWHENRMYRGLHLCPINLANILDAGRTIQVLDRIQRRVDDGVDPWAGAYDQWNRPYDLGDDIVRWRTRSIEDALSACNADAYNRRKHLRPILDIRNPKDYIEVGDALRARYGYYGSSPTNLTPCVIMDSDHPSLGYRGLALTNSGQGTGDVTKVMREYVRQTNYHHTAVVNGIDENIMSPAVKAFRRALFTDKGQISQKAMDTVKKSGRWTVLEDEPAQFPITTRCNLEDINWKLDSKQLGVLVFAFNRWTGAYRPVRTGRGHEDEFGNDITVSHGDHWLNNDFMLIHRSDDKWRFLFRCASTFVPKLGSRATMHALIPYTVEDSECSAKPRLFSPQRGMPKAVTKAIRETPFCAAAISHATSRMKYLSGAIPMLGREVQVGNVDVDGYDVPMLWRAPTRNSAYIIGPNTTNRSAVTRAQDSYSTNGPDWDVEAVLTTELARLPHGDIQFGEAAETNAVSVLGQEAHEARALCLDD